MLYKTKQKRLAALLDAYLVLHKKTAVTMEEVSEWALSKGLYPCPRRGDPDEQCEEWERRLANAGGR